MGATLTLELPEKLNSQILALVPEEEMSEFLLSAAQDKVDLYKESDVSWIAEVNEAIDDALAGRNLYTLEEADKHWNETIASVKLANLDSAK